MEEATLHAQTRLAFAEVMPSDDYAAFDEAMAAASDLLRGHTMWHINTTLTGGGVAEMLSAMLPYVVDAGIDCRWVTMGGSNDFLDITKRLHNALHGFEGDGGRLGAQEKQLYLSTLAGDDLVSRVHPGDVAFVHDPQTAGLIPALKERGATVIWHCHIGADSANEIVRKAWSFLTEGVSAADRYIFSRAEYLWEGLDPGRLRVIQPSINPFSGKNRLLSSPAVEGILDGLVPLGNPFIMQTARWDRLKDQIGVMRLFDDHLAGSHPDLHLVVAGPSVEGVSDDPEGEEVLAECKAFHGSLGEKVRSRVHLLCTPMDDLREAELVVNALQRRARVVLQKSLAEGFGLVVAEAMWKERPVVASRVGGIQDQIEHGRSGMLVDDPNDGAAFARAVAGLLDDERGCWTHGGAGACSRPGALSYAATVDSDDADDVCGAGGLTLAGRVT